MQNIDNFSGLVFPGGGTTSHVAILAKLNRVPCIMGANLSIQGGDFFVDGERLMPFSKVTIDGSRGYIYQGWLDYSNDSSSSSEQRVLFNLSNLEQRLTKIGANPNFIHKSEDIIFFPKSIGLRLLESYGLTIPMIFEPKELPSDVGKFSVRTSFPLKSDHSSLRKIGYSMPSKFGVISEDIPVAVEEVRASFYSTYHETPDLIVHETHSVKQVGNIEVSSSLQRAIIESWKSYEKQSQPLIQEIGLNDDHSFLFEDTVLPTIALHLPFNVYILEWVITDEGELIFTDLSVIQK